MKSDTMRIIGWVIPVLCMAIAAFGVFRQHQRLQTASADLQAAQQEVVAATLTRTQVEQANVETRYAAGEQNSFEESFFLNDLRNRAAESGVTIVQWTSKQDTYDVGSGEDEKSKKLQGITRISSDLSLAGHYSAVRRFLTDITTGDRLFTLSNVRWSRSERGTELTVTLARYVGPGNPLSVPSANGATTPASVQL